jgi:glucokinase
MKYALVVDLGATNLRVAIVNDQYKIEKKAKCNVDRNKDIAFNIYSSYKSLGVEYDLEGIAVGVAGSIDFKKNIIRDLPNLKIKEYDLHKALYKLFGIPIKIVNDASLAALGEYLEYKEEKVFQYITISSGIGGGLIYHGKLFEGNNGFEQEIGRIDVNGELFESLCSGNALKNRLLKENIDEEYASAALMSQKENYRRVVDAWLDDLSVGIASIIKVVNPGIIVFGGGLGIYIDYFKNELIKRLKEKLPRDVVDDLKIAKAKYGDDSAIIGGCYLIFQDN